LGTKNGTEKCVVFKKKSQSCVVSNLNRSISTRDEQLDQWTIGSSDTTSSGYIFVKLACSKMGFAEPEFLGLKDNYKTFMRSQNRTAMLNKVLQLNNDCIPDYKIAGGQCNDTAKNLEDVSLLRVYKENP